MCAVIQVRETSVQDALQDAGFCSAPESKVLASLTVAQYAMPRLVLRVCYWQYGGAHVTLQWSIADLEQLVEDLSGLKQSAGGGGSVGCAQSFAASVSFAHRSLIVQVGQRKIRPRVQRAWTPSPSCCSYGLHFSGSRGGDAGAAAVCSSCRIHISPQGDLKHAAAALLRVHSMTHCYFYTRMLQVKKDGHMKKRKLGDLVSGGGSSSSDECTEAQVSSVVCSSSLIFYSVLKAIELARTLKPDDAMRVRANDVKVAPP